LNKKIKERCYTVNNTIGRKYHRWTREISTSSLTLLIMDVPGTPLKEILPRNKKNVLYLTVTLRREKAGEAAVAVDT